MQNYTLQSNVFITFCFIFVGKILWVIDPETREWSNHFKSLWTVHLGPTVQDLDQDGVMDLIILHSPDKESWVS